MLKVIGRFYLYAGTALTLFCFFSAFGAPKKEDVGQGLMFGDMTQGGMNQSSFAFVIEKNHHFNQKKVFGELDTMAMPNPDLKSEARSASQWILFLELYFMG